MSWLNTQYIRKDDYAMAVIIGQGIGHLVILHLALKKQARKANAIISDLGEVNAILGESTQFLLDHADEKTVEALDRKLDFWRTVRGQPIPTVE